MKQLWPAAALLVVLVAVVSGAFLLRPHDFTGTVIQSPQTAPAFTLTGSTGDPLNITDFRGKIVVLYFGYTFCPDICPTTMLEIRDAMDLLGRRAEDVQVIMVSVDPDRDTPDRLDEYVTYFHEDFLGAVGTEEEIAEVAALYGIYYAANTDEGDNYTVDHTSSVMALDREGHMKIVFSPDTQAEAMAADLRELLRR